MLESNINFGSFFLLCFINSFVLSESNINLHLPTNKRLVKRHDNDFQTCLDNFDVHQDKIIRTQDSRDMGAKFLNERDLFSRDECLRLCCETESCDVFVFEEKAPGSCYLFECGTPEDFKCKFTKHKNYTSAVLAVNRHLTELESQIKFTQHEHELTKLRQPPELVDLSKSHAPTTEVTKNQESIKYGIERPPSQSVTTKGQVCSRYQFECHTSGECIAIYNACDGIPQCADGSDEAVELGCPATSTALPTVTTLNPTKAEVKSHKENVEHKKELGEVPIVDSSKQVQQPYVAEGAVLNPGYPQNQGQPNGPPTNLRASYGREGEGIANYHPEQQWSYQYHPNQGSSQIFTHKGNGLVVPQQNERYSQHQYVPQDIPQRPIMQQYGEQFPNDYNKYYYDNMGYRMIPQGQTMNTWQAAHKTHDVPSQMLDDGGMSRLDNIPVANAPGPDYYYEEGYRNRPQQYVQRLPIPPAHPNVENKVPEVPMEPISDKSGVKHDVPKKKPPTHPPETTTTKPKEVTPAHVSHRKVDKVSADLKMKESSLEDLIDGHNSSPSGAVLSLAMGLCITAIMLIFVACRMKVVRKRMRRGGKSPYAHDADFLVNGMYL